MQHHRISSAFAAAQDYDRHARVQRVVARETARRIAQLPLPPNPRVLEIGCGTGFLTEALLAYGHSGEWLITDIAAEMVGRCRQRVGDAPGRRFAVLDGEFGQPEGETGFDLICSSLAMQWFQDQDSALSRMIGWLKPGGHCVFTTLTAGSFAEWRAAHALAGLEPGTPEFLPIEAVRTMQPRTVGEQPRVTRYVERHESALDFMRSLRSIGAHTASQRHRPLGAGQIRQVMRHFENAGAAVTYEVATCHHIRPSGACG